MFLIFKKSFKTELLENCRLFKRQNIEECFSFSYVCDTSSSITNSSFVRIILWCWASKNHFQMSTLAIFSERVFALENGKLFNFLYLNRACKFYIFMNVSADFMHLRTEMTSWMCYKLSNLKLWAKLSHEELWLPHPLKKFDLPPLI